MHIRRKFNLVQNAVDHQVNAVEEVAPIEPSEMKTAQVIQGMSG